MNTPEIYGISEDTLFRGYQEKIKYGRGIINMMMEFEKKEILGKAKTNHNHTNST
jgi:hypothetical protein